MKSLLLKWIKNEIIHRNVKVRFLGKILNEMIDMHFSDVDLILQYEEKTITVIVKERKND